MKEYDLGVISSNLAHVRRTLADIRLFRLHQPPFEYRFREPQAAAELLFLLWIMCTNNYLPDGVHFVRFEGDPIDLASAK